MTYIYRNVLFNGVAQMRFLNMFFWILALSYFILPQAHSSLEYRDMKIPIQFKSNGTTWQLTTETHNGGVRSYYTRNAFSDQEWEAYQDQAMEVIRPNDPHYTITSTDQQGAIFFHYTSNNTSYYFKFVRADQGGDLYYRPNNNGDWIHKMSPSKIIKDGSFGNLRLIDIAQFINLSNIRRN